MGLCCEITEMSGLEISEISGNRFSVAGIRFMGNCRKALFGSVNFDHENLLLFFFFLTHWFTETFAILKYFCMKTKN